MPRSWALGCRRVIQSDLELEVLEEAARGGLKRMNIESAKNGSGRVETRGMVVAIEGTEMNIGIETGTRTGT